MADAVHAALAEADAETGTWIDRIESLRARLCESDEEISVALSNKRGIAKTAPIGEVCRRRSKKPAWCRLLLEVARRVAPATCIELGTALGISSAYLAAGLRLGEGGRLVTLEGCDGLARRAATSLSGLGLDVDVRSGLFSETLPAALEDSAPVRLAFVDGHHQEGPTLQYFAELLPALTDPAIVVFDDIRWSDGMQRAWARLAEHEAVRVAVALTTLGVCVVGSAGDGSRTYMLPTITAMQSGRFS